LRHGALLSYKLFYALWLTLDALSGSVDVPLLNLLTYAAGAVLAMAAWRRALISQRLPIQTGRNGQ
jgi:hypothetical protein